MTDSVLTCLYCETRVAVLFAQTLPEEVNLPIMKLKTGSHQSPKFTLNKAFVFDIAYMELTTCTSIKTKIISITPEHV